MLDCLAEEEEGGIVDFDVSVLDASNEVLESFRERVRELRNSIIFCCVEYDVQELRRE